MNLFRNLLLILALLPGAMPATASGSLGEQLRHRLETLSQPGELAAGDQLLFALDPLQTIYLRREWRPLWFGDDAQPLEALDQVLDAIDLAKQHGLEPAHYHRALLVDLLRQMREHPHAEPDRRVLVDIELWTSDALVTLAHHLTYGRIDPETTDPGWFITREPPALLERLAQVARGANLTIIEILEALLPAHAEYRALVESLALERELAGNGNWELIESGALLRPGGQDERVSTIRQRLIHLGDLPEQVSTDSQHPPDHYDPILEQAVRRFQRRHGLNTDGVVGPRTLTALNISPQARIDQLRANLERWRWLPPFLGDEYIIVNIAGFNMQVVSHGNTIMRQRVVVGGPFRRTPVFTGQMSYLVLNPAWEVPHKLAVQDQLPKIKANPDYLDEMGFTLLQGWGASEVRVDPGDIEWSTLSARNFPYRLRQAPGPKNALGQVKFMFPNRHNVYLHDTPSRGLFSQEDRALSSGCIRLEQPEELTRWLLTERASTMSRQRIDAILASGRETTVRLERPIPVHLLYWTAWLDEEGLVQYRRDIYQRDQHLIEALEAPAPRAAP